MKYLGIDYGTKRIGLAVSDEEGTVAFPKAVIKNQSDTIDLLAEIVTKEKVEKIIFGESKNFKMQNNPIMKNAVDLAEKLTEKTGIAHVFHQEFLTSHQVSSEIHHAHSKRNEKARGEKAPKDLDAQSATILLQSYLDLADLDTNSNLDSNGNFK